MNIIFYGGHFWEKGPWFRKQQFASRLVKRGHTVFYIESSVSMIRKQGIDNINYFKTKLKKIDNNLFIITPSALFPYPHNFFSRKLFNLKLFHDIKTILMKENINDYILWFNQVEFSSVLDHFNSIKIFDLADDVPYYSKLANDEKGYKVMMKYIKLAFSKSDISIVSALKIKEKYSKYSKGKVIVIPNGHNINFSESNTFDCKKNLDNIEKPIVGFVGTLFRFIDDQLLEYIIDKRPNYNFVFVGPIQSNFPIHKISKYKNVYLLGEKPRNEIPLYINCFDVCINPFKIHEVNDSVSPVKVFEYLALKKIVISTKMYSLMKEKIAEYIVFSNDYDDFLTKLDSAISNKIFQNITQHELKEYSWDRLFNKLIVQIKNNLDIKL